MNSVGRCRGHRKRTVTPISSFLRLFPFILRTRPACRRWTNDALEAITRHFGYKRIGNSDRVSMHIGKSSHPEWPFIYLKESRDEYRIDIWFSTAWGLGQGIARCIFFFASNALLAFGPGTLYSSSCPTLPYFFTTGENISLCSRCLSQLRCRK